MRNVRLALWALASVAALWSFSGVAMAEKRVALVVGNAAYRHTTPLINTKKDATDMIKALEDLKFKVISGIDQDGSSFHEKLKEFWDAAEGASAAVFFYAGHASQYQGVNYLTPIDATPVEEKYDYDNHISLQKVLGRMQSETNIVFLDACRDNPLDGRFRSRSTSGASMSRGLARVSQGDNGTYIAYATAPGRVAEDGKPGGNSPFTHALLQHIRRSNVTILNMMTDVKALVVKNTNSRQRPWAEESLLTPFFFSKSEAVTPNPLSVSPPPPSKPAGVYLRVGAGAGQKIEESHLEVVAKDRISAHEINGYSGVGGGCYSEGISAGTRLVWGHIALCSR